MMIFVGAGVGKEARADPRGLQGLPSGKAQLQREGRYSDSDDFRRSTRELEGRFKVEFGGGSTFVSFVGGEYGLSQVGRQSTAFAVPNRFPNTILAEKRLAMAEKREEEIG
jgi:hypothetical protein